MMAITPKEFIGKAEYDDNGQFIWGVTDDDGHQMLLQLRGWGAIQCLFKRPDNTIDFEEADKFQDELGQWIADAINQKLNK